MPLARAQWVLLYVPRSAGSTVTLSYTDGKLTGIDRDGTALARYAYSGQRLTKLTDAEADYSLSFTYSGGRVSSSTSPSIVAGDADSSRSESKTPLPSSAPSVAANAGSGANYTRITSANSAEMTFSHIFFIPFFSLLSLFLVRLFSSVQNCQFRVFFKSNYVLSI